MSKLLGAQLVCYGAALALFTAVAHGAMDGHPAAAPPSAAAPSNQAASEDALARFKGGQITVADMEAAIANKDPRTRRSLATTDGQLKLLRELETYDLLVLEAERRGYAKNPTVADAKRRAAIDAMLAGELRVAPASISSADVAVEYANRVRMAGPVTRPLSKVEGAVRKELARQRVEKARDELVKRLYQQYQPEIHPELIAAITIGPVEPLDQPSGFPAAPPDPRAPTRTIESDGF